LQNHDHQGNYLDSSSSSSSWSPRLSITDCFPSSITTSSMNMRSNDHFFHQRGKMLCKSSSLIFLCTFSIDWILLQRILLKEIRVYFADLVTVLVCWLVFVQGVRFCTFRTDVTVEYTTSCKVHDNFCDNISVKKKHVQKEWEIMMYHKLFRLCHERKATRSIIILCHVIWDLLFLSVLVSRGLPSIVSNVIN
jgi:hypothetical protein